MNRSKIAGFTLVELMIAAAIIVVLAAIAFPAYQAQVEKSRRTEARAALSDIQLAQERFFTVNGSYTNNFTQLGLTAGDYTSITSNAVVTRQSYYGIGFDSATATTFVANAVAQGGQAGDDDCDWLAISHLGVKTADTAACW